MAISKKIEKELECEKSELKEIWLRIKKRNFSGNSGLAIKNSIYQTLTNIAAKGGSFIFTIILARLLMPELFGLYSLALSTIVIFASFSELGISNTMIRFISKELSKKSKKLRAHILYLGKIKAFLLLLCSIIIILSANYLANTFYQKPIFLALIAGVLYIMFIQITSFLQCLLQASNNFSAIFKREIIFQILRIILVPLAVVFAIRYSLQNEINLMLIMFFLAIALLLASISLFLDVKKIYYKKLKQEKLSKLSKNQKKNLNKFFIATSALVLSGIFFGNIDRVMLGKFVAAEFIGYYAASFSLIGALTTVLAFSAAVLFPIFSRLKGKKLEIGFQKSRKMTLFISGAAFIATLILAYLVILVIYGNEYIPATNILRILALLIPILPIIGIYQVYYLSQGKAQKVARLLIIATILNIALNYILITSLLHYSQLAATYGAALATLLSQSFYLGGLIRGRRKNKINN
ncbi:hypothetical protein FJZ20_00585 [Candidatus Pacearchaeota archaeon]|nr:hypothetical protein [Candidatus Pacearchaeota archaeon]